MSIVAAADPEGSAWGVLVAAFIGAAAVVVAALLGVFRPAGLGLEPRVPPPRPLMPLVGVLFAGLVVWLVAPSLFVQLGPLSPAEPVSPTTAKLETRQLVTLNAAVPLVAFAVLAVGNTLVRPRVGQRLGFEVTRVPGGLLWGAAGIAIALPLVYCVLVLTQWVYQSIGYKHPNEHELLAAMKETKDPVVKYLAVVVAVVIAPVWEEFLFRGHIQTLIREGLIRLREAGRAAGEWTGFQVAGLPGGIAAPAVSAPARAEAATKGFALETWLAILMASVVFASVHQPWQFPAIFCLSVCLGLAYERTGNLWVPTVMHALFNGLMTAYFLWRSSLTH